MQGEVAFGLFQCGVDNSARHAQPAVVVQYRTDCLTAFNTVGRGILEADLFKNTVDVLNDGFEILIGKRMVAAAAFSGLHGLHGVFQWCTALRMPCLPASCTSRHRQVPP